MEIIAQSTKTTTPRPYVHLGYIAASNYSKPHMGFFSSGLVLFVLGIILSVRIKILTKNSKILKTSFHVIKSSAPYWNIGILCLILSAVLVFTGYKKGVFTYSQTYKRYSSMRNLDKISQSLFLYAKEHADSLPSSQHWCDILIEEGGLSPENFLIVGSDVMIGESAYALNENVLNMKCSNIPGDIVVIFETNSGINGVRSSKTSMRSFVQTFPVQEDFQVYPNRWNQVTGSEAIKSDYYKNRGIHVLFGQGRVGFVSESDISQLKWHPDKSGMPLKESASSNNI